MMVTKEDVLAALRDVEDPEVHKSIVELEMVRRVEIEGAHVTVEVALTISGCPLRHTIERAVREKLLALDGVASVDVIIGNMTDEERARFTEKLRGRAQPQEAPPLLREDAGVQFLAIASGKGGVGKSTVTANLARALAQAGVRVGVIDADIYGFSLPGIFGVQQQRPTVIDDLILPIEVEGVKLISMHFFVPPGQPVIWRGPMLGKMLRNFFSEVHWGDVELVLLDLPPGTGDVALDVHQLLPRCKELIVTTPQANAAEVAVRAGAMALRTQHEVIGVVENMSYVECGRCGERMYVFGRGGGARVAEALRTEVLAEVPLANLDQQPASLFAPGSRQAEVYRDLAGRVIEKLGVRLSAPSTVR